MLSGIGDSSETCAARDVDFEQLVDAYQRPILSFARVWIDRYDLRDELEPEDLVNIVFTSILEHPERISRLNAMQLWVYLDRAAMHAAHDIYRWKHRSKRDARRRLALPFDCVANLAADADADSELEFNEALVHAYECLTSEERTIAMWRRAGYEWHLVAEWMGRSEAAVRKQFERAILRVRRSWRS